MDKHNINDLNRDNFRILMHSLAHPGTNGQIKPVFDSFFLGIASCLLYPEVAFFYKGTEDFSLLNLITNSNKAPLETADYIFCDGITVDPVTQAKSGTFKNPEFSASVFFKCRDFDGIRLKISGPGIKNFNNITLPVDKYFIESLNKKNGLYPLGIEVFFINDEGLITALSRTTTIEVI
ncbi:phosphonate C-P lyase system protein PhnH [Flexistipes sp.]|uniref:phosphonate C-P lyase system protein PhnH n=1 Tax=Flexistipes sp. TaxID=3088135 RepID=UPI002E201DCD|nr:phosphonate C-P lyase system protein PhnH [Flexistipes sp.]